VLCACVRVLVAVDLVVMSMRACGNEHDVHASDP
jgi:hypothetical protein